VKFAEPLWLFGAAGALLVAALLVAGGVLLGRSIRRFGDEALVLGLLTARAGYRRALKGVLLVLAVALAFLALAQPQYGRGTRLIPATNLDVVLVLDFSKSMYARDIPPSRTLRAKSEVSKLIAALPGARFGAVAFAGQPMAFPLTSDGAAIAQFFRQISPNDMPVGGTAIARALEAGRELLLRDPLSKGHRRVMVLVTDGEDLEGDPVAVAENARQDEITIYVVQIGGRTPEPIPEVNEAGETIGFRVDEQGQTITTSLSAEGEEQLGKIASVTGGNVVRSAQGETGIAEVERRLKLLMTEELSERVETVYADVYAYPLALALLLLVLETFVSESRKRGKPTIVPPPLERRGGRRKLRRKAAAVAGLLALALGGCSKTVDDLFTRNSPIVDEAIGALDAGDAGASAALLQEYLSTGKCEGGSIGAPDPVRTRPSASLDLGLSLFVLAERFGKRFGEEESSGDGGTTPADEVLLEKRGSEVECALRIVRLIANDDALPIELRARAHYLSGNLEFLRRDYRSAVAAYDQALTLIPGLPADAGDGIGRDAAYNRAIALRRIEQNQRDAGPDAPPPEGGPPEAGPDSEPDGGPKDQDGGTPDAGPPESQGQDAGDDGSQPNRQDQQPDAGREPEPEPKPEARRDPSVSQDERILDQLEQAPTFQEQDAKNRALKRGNSRASDDR
jgi:Ca-activated chloride channel family protein